MKILSIGNSFSIDTMQHVVNIAGSADVTDLVLGNLYIGGCSIHRHYNNAINDLAEYIYYYNDGSGWVKTPDYPISRALTEPWDIISIQHGSCDGSCYTKAECYEELGALISYVKAHTENDPRIAFNMAWVPEPDSGRREISSFGGDQLKMYEALTGLTRQLVAPQVDLVSPAGTAIQNARTVISKKLTRDDFHLSLDLGRYIAGLTFLKALTNQDLDSVTWAPQGVTAQEQQWAKLAADQAVNAPWQITPLDRPSPPLQPHRL